MQNISSDSDSIFESIIDEGGSLECVLTHFPKPWTRFRGNEWTLTPNGRDAAMAFLLSDASGCVDTDAIEEPLYRKEGFLLLANAAQKFVDSHKSLNLFAPTACEICVLVGRFKVQMLFRAG